MRKALAARLDIRRSTGYCRRFMINEIATSSISFLEMAQSWLMADPLPDVDPAVEEEVREQIQASSSIPPPPEQILEPLSFFDRILPPIDGPRPELRFAAQRTPLRIGLEALFGEEHKVYGALGVATNVHAIALFLAHYAMLSGARPFLSQYARHATTQEHIPVGANGVIDIARRHFLYGIEIYARALGLDVVIEGAEKIPDEGMVMQLAANHASIFPDFLFAWADPRFAPVADVENFSLNRLARLSGAALYFDLLGLPFIKRKKRGEEREEDARRRVAATDELSRRLMELMLVHGVRPIFFGQGGRAPTAYNDDGSQAPAGFYANAPDRNKPEVYFQAGGVIVAASRIARKTGRNVSIALVSMSGGEMVMPKDAAKKFPYVGKARMDRTVTYRVADVLTISPGERRLRAIEERAIDILRRDLGIDEYLEEVVAKWACDAGRPELAAAYARLAPEDVRLRIIADRIRSVHPRRAAREGFKRQLLALIGELSGGREGFLTADELLAGVTAAIR